MNMKKISSLLLIIGAVLLFASPFPAYAAKKRVRTTAKTGGISYSSVKLSRGTNSIILTLANLTYVSRASYELSYDTNGISQGVTGAITPTNPSETRDLYFGTCSKGVCTPHTNITHAVLLVQVKTKTGSVTTKRYLIRL
jgi:hypothetical protein